MSQRTMQRNGWKKDLFLKLGFGNIIIKLDHEEGGKEKTGNLILCINEALDIWHHSAKGRKECDQEYIVQKMSHEGAWSEMINGCISSQKANIFTN